GGAIGKRQGMEFGTAEERMEADVQAAPPPADALLRAVPGAGGARPLRAVDYRPPWWLRNGHLQTMLGSSPWRQRRGRRALAALGTVSSTQLVDGGDGVRLQGV